MTPLNEAKAIALDCEAWIAAIERDKGPQPKLRHRAHMLQMEAESVLVVPLGTLLSGGGVKPPSGDGS